MEFKEIEGSKISVIGMGTWKMGGDITSNTLHDDECIAALKYGIKLGMTHIDTAEIYSSGHAEELVAKAIKDFDREKLFITSKVWQTNLRYNDVIKAAKASLKRLEIDQMDLYLVHWPNPSIPLKETMRGMEYLVENGLTKFIGVSNFDVKLVKEAQSYLDKSKIVADQVEFSLTNKEPEKELLPFCQKEKIMLIAYSPIKHIVNRRIDLLDELSKKYNKTPVQIALNWLISKPQVVTIPKAVNIKHMEENAGAVGWKLDKEDVRKLNKSTL